MAITKSFLENKRYVQASTSSTETFVVGTEAVRVSLGNKINGDKIAIEGFATDYRVRISGNTVTLQGLEENSSGKLVVVQTITFALAKSEAATLEFMDGSLRLARAADGKTTLGAQPVGKSAVRITGDGMLAPTSVDEVSEAVNGPPAPPAPTPTYALTADTATANEGRTVYFTLNTTGVATGTQLVYALSGVAAADILGGSVSGTVTIGSTGRVIIPVTIREDATTEGAETLTMTVGGQSASIAIADSSITPPPAAQTVVLNTEPEAKVAGAGDDVFRGTDKTLLLDKLDGDAHVNGDTLIYNDTTGAVNINALGLEMTGVEIVEARSIGGAVANTTKFAGVTALKATFGTSTTLTAATTTDVTVTAGITGAITIDGGKNISVTDETKDTDITIGATTVGAGSVNVTATKAGTTTIAIDGGTDVTVNASGMDVGITAGATDDDITVGNGGASTDLPSGVVRITNTHTAAAGDDVNLNDVVVKGGSTVTVTQVADTSKAAADTTGATLTQGDVAVTAGAATTTVNVTQAASTTEVVAVTAIAGVTETASVKFGALKAGDILIIGGNGDATRDAGELQFTAAVDMTADEVAAAFSNLVKGTVPVSGDTQGRAAADKGTFAGALTGWTSGAVRTDTVVFTSTTANSNVTNLAQNLAGTGTAPTITTTGGSAATAAVTGKLGVITGAVTIEDNATAAIRNITLDGYGTTAIGGTANVSKLETLSLANSGGATAGATNATVTANVGGSLATLGLTVNNVQGGVTLTGTGLTTLNITATGADSTFGLSAAAAETLTVTGTKALDIDTGSTLSALKTVTVTGSAGLSIDASGATVTTVNTAGTTGSVTAKIDGSKATYTGGAGVDAVEFSAATISKNVSLGAGNDRLDADAATLTGTFTFDGGNDTDTIVLTAAQAASLSTDALFEAKISGFERLSIDSTGTTARVIDLSNLDDISYVISAGTGAAGTLTVNKMGNGGTIALNDALAGTTVSMADATGASDSLNVLVDGSGDTNANTLTVAGVETLTIGVDDSDNNGGADRGDTVTLTVAANAAKSITVRTTDGTAADKDGNQDLTELNLTVTGATALETVDASALLGNFTFTADRGTTKVTGGSGNDALTASGTSDTLIGGAGDDTLIGANLSTLTGEAGNDVFKVNAAVLNVNSYSSITDFAAGDLIQFVGADSFQAAKVTLGATAVFQDYANAAMNAIGANDVAWFQFGGNTYIVMDEGTTNSTTFINTEDYIIQVAGLVDLSGASFNVTNGTIAL